MDEITKTGKRPEAALAALKAKRDAKRLEAAAARTPPSHVRSKTRNQHIGRNGEVLTRNATLGLDQFEIPVSIKEAGWDYQWLTERVYNDTDITRRHSNTMYQAGWRPVMATGRWNGVFGPPSYTAHVTLGDSALYERPQAMTDEARADDVKRARKQMSDRDQSLMGGRANLRGSLAPGMEMSNRYRGTGADLRMSIDPALDAPTPSHQLADDSVS